MNNKIELPLDLAERLQRALNQVGVQDHLCDYALVSNAQQELKDVLERSRLLGLSAAPVVERHQADDPLSKGFYTTQSGNGNYSINIGFRSLAEMQSADKQMLDLLRGRTAPPELAELQATIAQQAELLREVTESVTGRNGTFARIPADWFDRRDASVPASVEVSEIERLKGGQGEPVAYVLHKNGEVDWDQEVVISNTGGDEPDERFEWRPVYASQPAPVSAEAAKAFAKGFNTLETLDGKYKIIMQFAGHDDAWAAYTELSQMTACLDKVKELNQ